MPDAANEFEWNCPYCGNVIKGRERAFCLRCGTALRTGTDRALSAPPEAKTGGIRTALESLLFLGVVGAMIGVALLGAYVLVIKPTQDGGGSGSITYSPDTISCSSPVEFVETMRLPATVLATDVVTIRMNGLDEWDGTLPSGHVGTHWKHNDDGTWESVWTRTASEIRAMCSIGSILDDSTTSALARGQHVKQILDSTGKELAKGSYTVV